MLHLHWTVEVAANAQRSTDVPRFLAMEEVVTEIENRRLQKLSELRQKSDCLSNASKKVVVVCAVLQNSIQKQVSLEIHSSSMYSFPRFLGSDGTHAKKRFGGAKSNELDAPAHMVSTILERSFHPFHGHHSAARIDCSWLTLLTPGGLRPFKLLPRTVVRPRIHYERKRVRQCAVHSPVHSVHVGLRRNLPLRRRFW